MNPQVAYLAVLQFKLSSPGPWRAVPRRSAVHLACGGGSRVWGDTLCRIPFGKPGAAHATVGGGITDPRIQHIPCYECARIARVFPGIPILGVPDLAQPVADLLGVHVQHRIPDPAHPGAVT